MLAKGSLRENFEFLNGTWMTRICFWFFSLDSASNSAQLCMKPFDNKH